MIEKHLIQKYFDGVCSTEELTLVLEWLHDEKVDHTFLREMMMERWERDAPATAGAKWRFRLLFTLRQLLYPDAANSGFSAVQGEAANGRLENPESLPIIGLRRSWLKYAIAASIAGVLFTGGWVVNNYRIRALAAQWRTISNNSTKMKYCTLPDSSKVWLNPKSTLSWRMPPDEGATRAVRIEGQAFFDVAKDESRPFLAYSGPIVTRVLGTAFDVEAYPEEKDIRICLVGGRVSVEDTARASGRRAEIMRGGEMMTYIKEAGAIHKAPLKMTALPDWTSGHLIFSEVPVKVALERLARLYHFSLRYGKGVHLENDRFSTAFTREETPEQMIRNILFITDYTYHISDNEVEIVRK